MDPLAAIKVTFFQECEEQLAELEGGLLAMEGGDHDPEIVNAVFRAVHSIKGGAGAFSLEDLVRFSHVFETALDLIRSGDIQADQETLKLLLRSADVLADHVRAARDGGSVDEGRSSAMAEALEALASGMGGGGEADTGDGFADFVFNPVTIDMSDAAAPAPDLSIEDLLARVTGEAASTSDVPAETAGDDVTWHIRFYPQVGLYQKANESGLLLRELARLGKVEVRLDASGLPTLQNMNPEDAYLGWSVALSGPTLEEASIREVFEWVEGDCYLDIVREGAAPAAAVAAGTAPAASIDAVGEVDVMALIRAAQAAEVPAAAMTPPTAAPRPAEAPAKVEPTKTREAALDAKAQAAALSAELEARSALPPQVAAALDALPADSTHPMTQLAVGTLAMQSGSKFAQAYAEGLHKSRYWEPVLEDSLDLIARLPALAARIYRRTYHGGKYIEAKVKNEKRRVFFFFQVFVFFSFPATSFLKNLFFSLSLSLFPLSQSFELGKGLSIHISLKY